MNLYLYFWKYDIDGIMCVFGGLDGNYIMYVYVIFGNLLNNNKFFFCSIN